MSEMISLQLEFRQEVPLVYGNKDYREYRNLLERIDEMLCSSGIEAKLIKQTVKAAEEKRCCEMKRCGILYKPMSSKELKRFQKRVKEAFRCGVARPLRGFSYRTMSAQLADSPLLRWFCLGGEFGVSKIKVPSKSELERMDKLFSSELLREMVVRLTRDASNEAVEFPLGLLKRVSLEDYYGDTTCVKANIHYPVDWVLLRDATRTLMKAVALIRKAGLKHRMLEPETFISSMNCLCMKMGHLNRAKDGRKKRKAVLRLMKKVVRKVKAHAERHQELLELSWADTALSEGQMKQITKRIEGVLEQLPKAVKQAHDRIIGGRKIQNKDKLLSLYESDVHVQIRKKSGAEVEFGNRLLLAEQSAGLIVDWKLYKEELGSDATLLPESLKRFQADYERLPKRASTDRGFDSFGTRKYLKKKGIENSVCARSIKSFEEQLNDDSFCQMQNRRSQTEGRIGIFKNCFLGKPLRSKGFSHQELSVDWCVLAHNLWVLARLPQAEEQRLSVAA